MCSGYCGGRGLQPRAAVVYALFAAWGHGPVFA
jgi:hypothetical protein